MNTISPGIAGALAPAVLLLALGACDRTDTRVSAKQAGRDAAEATKTMGANAQVEPKDASATAAAAPHKAVDDAGWVTAKVAEQARPDDALIAAKVTTGLAADRNLSVLKIKVDSREGVVTLRGPVPNAAARARAEEIARNVQGVTAVSNQISVQPG